MEVLNDIVGYKNRKIYQNDKYFSFSLDSIILANYVSIRNKDKKIVDLGTGNGIIPLILSLRTDSKIIGVEIQENLVAMAKKSVEYNNLSNQIDIINSDMKDYSKIEKINSVDIITCNPPYFTDKNQKTNLSLEKTIARHEVKIRLSDIFSISKKLLKNGGKLAMVHRTERFYEVLKLFKENNLEPKRLVFVHENENNKASLFFVEGIKNGKEGLVVEDPFILYNKDGKKNEKYENLLTEVRR